MQSSYLNLGLCCYDLGDYPRAIDHHQQSLAIARDIGNRQGERTALGNLGNCYYSLGDYPRAIDHHQQSLAIARDIGNRQGEGNALGNLGNCYYSLGDYPRAIDHHQQHLAIARDIGDRYGEGNALVSLGDVYRDTGRWVQAHEYFQDASKIADAIGNRQNQHEARFSLALARLYAGDLGAAREAIDGARQYDYPQNTAAAWTATGVIRLRQGEPAAASKAFADGLAEADGLLEHCGQNFSALDTKGLALCGLALCEDEGHLTPAGEAFGAARKITQAKGVVARVLSQFDALALADTDAILSPARKAAEGQ
jgi:tetratricopeptide (TPR) repeat protein